MLHVMLCQCQRCLLSLSLSKVGELGMRYLTEAGKNSGRRGHRGSVVTSSAGQLPGQELFSRGRSGRRYGASCYLFRVASVRRGATAEKRVGEKWGPCIFLTGPHGQAGQGKYPSRHLGCRGTSIIGVDVEGSAWGRKAALRRRKVAVTSDCSFPLALLPSPPDGRRPRSNALQSLVI